MMHRFRTYGLMVLLLMSSVGMQAQFSGIARAIARENYLNENATLLWGQRGCEAQGYVVALGPDGYFSIWNDNGKNWQVATPAGSILIKIILYDPRAACIQRWTGSNWCIIDMQGNPKKRGMHQNTEVVGYFYDDVKCVSHRAPIAVGKGRDADKRKWGLVTRDPKTGVWSHSVDDTWDDIKIKLSGPDDIFYAQAHKPGYSALYALDGSVIAEGSYDELRIEDHQIICKQNGQWTVLKPFVVLPNYTR